MLFVIFIVLGLVSVFYLVPTVFWEYIGFTKGIIVVGFIGFALVAIMYSTFPPLIAICIVLAILKAASGKKKKGGQ